jgi:hypothetical protein
VVPADGDRYVVLLYIHFTPWTHKANWLQVSLSSPSIW